MPCFRVGHGGAPGLRSGLRDCAPPDRGLHSHGASLCKSLRHCRGACSRPAGALTAHRRWRVPTPGSGHGWPCVGRPFRGHFPKGEQFATCLIAAGAYQLGVRGPKDGINASGGAHRAPLCGSPPSPVSCRPMFTSVHASTPSHPAPSSSAPLGEERLEWRHLQSHDVPLISPRLHWLLTAGCGCPARLSRCMHRTVPAAALLRWPGWPHIHAIGRPLGVAPSTRSPA